MEHIDNHRLAETVESGLRSSVRHYQATDVVLKMRQPIAPPGHRLHNLYFIEFVSLRGTVIEDFHVVEQESVDTAFGFDMSMFDDPEFVAELEEALLYELQQPRELTPENVIWDFVSPDVVKESLDHITNVDMPNGEPTIDARTGRTVVFQKIFEDLVQ